MKQRLGRAAPLPKAMQGRWVDVDDRSSVLVVTGGEVALSGQAIEYDYKDVAEMAGAVAVSLRVVDEAQEEAFERANLTELVLTPDGEFHAYNSSFATEFVRR